MLSEILAVFIVHGISCISEQFAYLTLLAYDTYANCSDVQLIQCTMKTATIIRTFCSCEVYEAYNERIPSKNITKYIMKKQFLWRQTKYTIYFKYAIKDN